MTEPKDITILDITLYHQYLHFCSSLFKPTFSVVCTPLNLQYNIGTLCTTLSKYYQVSGPL